MPAKRPFRRSVLPAFVMPNPGATLREQLLEKIVTVIFSIIMAGVAMLMALEEEAANLFHYDARQIRWSLVVLFVTAAVWGWYRSRKAIHNLRLGIKGEREVGQLLEESRADGYRVFHSILCDKFDLDHVLIGPGGVFVIETKTYTKPKGENKKVVMNGDHILVGGYEPDRNPVQQVEANARMLAEIIKRQTGESVFVQAVILFPDWWVETATPNKNVWVLNPKMLPGELRKRAANLSEEKIHAFSVGLIQHQMHMEKMKNPS